MAALNAASHARMANSRSVSLSSGGSSGPYLGGITPGNQSTHDLPGSSGVHSHFQVPNHTGVLPPNSVNPSFDSSMSNSGPRIAPTQANVKQRQMGFLNGVANVMIKLNTPLPPALTGVPAPNYDPATSMFKVIEPSTEVGAFRLVGRDVDLFKLWGLVMQNGGGHAVCYSIYLIKLPA